MFSGIVETIGTVQAVRDVAGGRRLTVDCGLVADDAVAGASIAINGACLTVCLIDKPRLEFDVISETLAKSTLGRIRVGDRVNLERSLKVGDRIDGHFVQGHVDATAALSRRRVSQSEHVLWFRVPQEVAGHIIPKGSIAISGVSLTIAEVKQSEFSVALIPTTLESTILGGLREGDPVNIETDILVRTILHTLHGLQRAGGITASALKDQGYL